MAGRTRRVGAGHALCPQSCSQGATERSFFPLSTGGMGRFPAKPQSSKLRLRLTQRVSLSGALVHGFLSALLVKTRSPAADGRRDSCARWTSLPSARSWSGHTQRHTRVAGGTGLRPPTQTLLEGPQTQHSTGRLERNRRGLFGCRRQQGAGHSSLHQSADERAVSLPSSHLARTAGATHPPSHRLPRPWTNLAVTPRLRSCMHQRGRPHCGAA